MTSTRPSRRGQRRKAFTFSTCIVRSNARHGRACRCSSSRTSTSPPRGTRSWPPRSLDSFPRSLPMARRSRASRGRPRLATHTEPQGRRPGRQRMRLPVWLSAVLLALVVVRTGGVIVSAVSNTHGDFYASLPGAYVRTVNPTLWESPDMKGAMGYHRDTYYHGPVQYL